jgi:hypothetical protein
MNNPPNIVSFPVCPSCDRTHVERVSQCPLCDRLWNQNVIGSLGVWDGLPTVVEDNPDAEYGYAAHVACGCGLVGPARITCEEAIKAWNKNAALIRSRIETGVPIDPDNVIKTLQQRGIMPTKEAA